MALELRLRLPLSPVALAALLAAVTLDGVAPVPWVTSAAVASHCTPPCDGPPPCDSSCCYACDTCSAYRPPACE
jgi:hypothetical protein